ncbi:MAG: PEP/pyruvate-binding domain-containing protein [Dehalococcoidia bacterium]|nr:PEP/pyruvate-binding domain-containing protein [Dehalococcoidia bacterium]
MYRFPEGDASMRDLLGGKGAGLAEMTVAGAPVPPGFTITTEACNAYTASGDFPGGMWEETLEALADVERQSGREFGSASNPLLLSVRSGARFSMPGMMDTILNLGLNDEAVEGLAKRSGDRRFAADSVPAASSRRLRADRARCRGAQVRRHPGGAQGARSARTRTSMPARWSRSSRNTRSSYSRRRARRSRRTRGNSSARLSRRCSARGTGGGPSTTGG